MDADYIMGWICQNGIRLKVSEVSTLRYIALCYITRHFHEPCRDAQFGRLYNIRGLVK